MTVVEAVPGPSGPGSVVLDIGGDIGAAIVYTPDSLAGSEIEIRRVGHAWDGTHVAVRGRHVPSGVVYAAVFESLKCGTYEARVRDHAGDDAVCCRFEVSGGRVVSERFEP